MSFQLSALPAEPFAPLFALSDEALAQRRILRRTADAPTGFPCRVSLADAAEGTRVLLLNYAHHRAPTPFEASHAIFVAEGARQAHPEVREVPEAVRRRLLSVRAFDARGLMVDADVAEGRAVEATIDRMFLDGEVAMLHLHNAQWGCYLARVDRV